MIRFKKWHIIFVFIIAFFIGFGVHAYDYSIVLSDGFLIIPAPIRMYTNFSYETKCAICSAAGTWMKMNDSELLYTTTEEHNDNDLVPNHNENNDVTKGYRGSTNYIMKTYYVHLNSTSTSCEETDIDFNVDHPFADATINPNVFDIQSTILHEFGHLLGLNDTLASSTVMYRQINIGEIKRDLSLDDIMGLYQIY